MTDHEMLERLCADMQEIKTNIGNLKETAEKIDSRLVRVETILEKDIVKGLQIMAEGNLNVRKRLDNVLRAEAELEIFKIQTTLLNTDVRELKEAVSNLKTANNAC